MGSRVTATRDSQPATSPKLTHTPRSDTIFAAMSRGTFLRAARLLFPLGMLTAAAAWAVEEVRFRDGAVRATATVLSFHPGGWTGFGYGAALADVEFDESLGALPQHGRPIRTALWDTPSPRSRLAVYYRFDRAAGRVDSDWQAFFFPTLLATIAAAWLLQTWLNRGAHRDLYGLASRGEGDASGAAPGWRTPGRH